MATVRRPRTRATTTRKATATATTRAAQSKPDAASRFSEVNLIADPLYGYIEITKGVRGEASESRLLDSPWLQRLRRIHQLQSAWWVFPTAEHSRFVHLLGAMHLASLFARRVDASLREAFSDAPSPALVEETLRLAGLLHDVGHGPFGHFFDQEVLARWGLDHEQVGRHLITHELADQIAAQRSSPSGPFESGEQVDPLWVAWLMADPDIEGYTPPPWLRALKPILCGPATVDNLDYVPRDAYMCGISLGPVEVRRLIHYTFVSGDTIVLHAHAVAALEMFLASRLYMYLNVYHHRTGRRFDLSLREVFADTIDKLLPGNPLQNMDAYLLLSDWSVLDAVQRWQTEPEGTQRRSLAGAWGRITSRDLRWHMAYETVLRGGVDAAALRERVLEQLPETLRPDVEVDVATARTAPNNPMTENGMVNVFDPLTGSVEHARTAAIIERLPQYNQVVRVFTSNAAMSRELHDAAERALDGAQLTAR